jgi:ribosomal protein S27E
MGKCCNKKITAEGPEHENICPYCGVWMSLPDGGSLEVATIYECARHDFGKRVKD